MAPCYRLAKGVDRGKYSRELVGRLALQLHLVREGVRDVTDASPIEVALQVEPAFDRSANRWRRNSSYLACIAHGQLTGTCSWRKFPVGVSSRSC